MSEKVKIASSTHCKDELEAILCDYSSVPLVQYKQLFGGYSGSSYVVELQDKTKYVLKVSNGYSMDHTESMCRTTYYLAARGFKDCCSPIPKIVDDSQKYNFVSSKESKGVPAFLLTFVEGQPADKVMREHPKLAIPVMRSIGDGLGRMHAASAAISKEEAEKHSLRWYETDGGCCDVEDQVNGKVLAKIAKHQFDDEAISKRFVPFYEKELIALKSEMEFAKNGTFALGITHGDAFADNIIVDPETGQLASFIDIEDITVGCLLFDLACCAIGSCFKKVDGDKYPQVLDFSLLEALLEGYEKGRKLSALEKEHFVPYMRLTLLCNCCWRFVKFNIDTPDVPEEAKNSYLELKRRIDYLHDPDIIRKILFILGKLWKSTIQHFVRTSDEMNLYGYGTLTYYTLLSFFRQLSLEQLIKDY